MENLIIIILCPRQWKVICRFPKLVLIQLSKYEEQEKKTSGPCFWGFQMIATSGPATLAFLLSFFFPCLPLTGILLTLLVKTAFFICLFSHALSQ